MEGARGVAGKLMQRNFVQFFEFAVACNMYPYQI